MASKLERGSTADAGEPEARRLVEIWGMVPPDEREGGEEVWLNLLMVVWGETSFNGLDLARYATSSISNYKSF